MTALNLPNNAYYKIACTLDSGDATKTLQVGSKVQIWEGDLLIRDDPLLHYVDASASASIPESNTKWLLQKLDDIQGLETYKITCVLDDNTTVTLTISDDDDFIPDVVGDTWSNSPKQKWTVHKVQSIEGINLYKITCIPDSGNTTLTLGLDDHGNICAKPWGEQRRQLWALQPQNITWLIEKAKTKYQDASSITPHQQDFTVTQTFDNPTKAKLTQTISETHTKTCSYTWSFKESLNIGIKFNAQIPVAKSEVNIQLGFESTQSTTKTTSQAFSVDQTIEIPPNESVECTCYIMWVDCSDIPFTMRLWLSGKIQTVNNEDGISLSSQEIMTCLSNLGMKPQLSDSSQEDKVVVVVEGTFQGSYGLKTSMSVKPLSP